MGVIEMDVRCFMKVELRNEFMQNRLGLASITDKLRENCSK